MKNFTVTVEVDYGTDIWNVTHTVKHNVEVESEDKMSAWIKVADTFNGEDVIGVHRVLVREHPPLKKLVASNVEIVVGVDKVKIDIYVNDKGNLIFEGLMDLGPVYYDLLDEELSFTLATDS